MKRVIIVVVISATLIILLVGGARVIADAVEEWNRTYGGTDQEDWPERHPDT